MTPLTWQRLALLVALTAAPAWLATRVAAANGFTPSPIPASVFVVSLAGAAFALVSAWGVRQYVRGKRPGLQPLRAARTAVFAQAAAYAGAILTGVHGGYALGIAQEWEHGPRREVAVTALVAAIGGLLLLAAGWIAERWCRVDGDDDDDEGEPEPA